MHAPPSAPPSSNAGATAQPTDRDQRQALDAQDLSPSPLQIIQILGLGILIGVLAMGLFLLLIRRPQPPPIVLQPPPTPSPTAIPSPTATPAPITVFVSGAVVSPGLYTLPIDARVGDALAAAGGLLADAASTLINQAEPLWDGAQIHVPVATEAASAAQPVAGVSGSAPAQETQATGANGASININTASLEALTTLPGVGPVKAESIIANRPFASVDELERVSGIGPKTVEQLRELVTVE